MFKPMKAPNEIVKLEDMKFPLLVSWKLDGIRCIIKDGVLYSSHMKLIPNKQIKLRFAKLATWAKENDIILDGELCCRSLTFHELSGKVRAFDEPIPEDLTFNCFDAVLGGDFAMGFFTRINKMAVLLETSLAPLDYVALVAIDECKSPEQVQPIYKEALAGGCDGVILRSSTAPYKCGRGTVKQGYIYKLKPYESFDAQIIGITQATEVDPNAEKKINELGHSETSKKKGDRILIDMAAGFIVMYNGQKLEVSIAQTHEARKEIWANQEKFMGRWIEYKGMLAGSKDLPRHATFLRYRDDKEGGNE